MNGFKRFPVDIWRLLLKDYCDFKTKQALSCVNKRSRHLFKECQLQHMESFGFWVKEHRIYDVDFGKLFKCFMTFKKVRLFYKREPLTNFLKGSRIFWSTCVIQFFVFTVFE